MPDNYDMWAWEERKKEEWLRTRPVCENCGEPIQDGYYYNIHGEFICVHCLNEYFREEID